MKVKKYFKIILDDGDELLLEDILNKHLIDYKDHGDTIKFAQQLRAELEEA